MIDFKRIPFEIEDYRPHCWAIIKNIQTRNNDKNKCYRCFGKLEKGYSWIPIDYKKSARINGLICRSCRILYVKDPNPIIELLKDNEFAKGISIDGHCFEDVSETSKRENKIQKEDKRNLLKTVNSSFIYFSVKSLTNEARHYIITKSEQPSPVIEYKSTTVGVLHYKAELARELLAGYYKGEKKKEVIINGSVFIIDEVLISEDNDPDDIIPSSVTIKKHGGLSIYVNSKALEIVDLLLYSHKSKRYEIVHATYDNRSHECYMDICIFRAFVKNHGNPEVKFIPDKEYQSKGHHFYEMNEESILHAYGYNVSRKDSLASSYRQSLLAEIVDLNILTVRDIVNYLDFYIETHSSDSYEEARSKWVNDRKFILNYNINPTRFLIVK